MDLHLRADPRRSGPLPVDLCGLHWYGNLPLLALCVLVMLPALIRSDLQWGQDAAHHLRWQYAFAEKLWSGTLYPRWMPSIDAGFGSPTFFIYPPLGHAVAALFQPLFHDETGALVRLGLSATIALYLGGCGIALWLRGWGLRDTACLAAAVCYTVAPYHIRICGPRSGNSGPSPPCLTSSSASISSDRA